MNKNELLALGLPEESLKEFQDLYHRDLMKAARRTAGRREVEELRTAITAMLPMIRDPENLRTLLMRVNYLYHAENRIPKEERAALDAANIRDGRAQQVLTDSVDVSSVNEKEENCKYE